MQVLRIIVFSLHGLVSLALIALVISQTSKHEGLGGAVGGATNSSFRGRAGFEEILAKYTGYAAFLFMFLSFLVFILVEKHGM